VDALLLVSRMDSFAQVVKMQL